MVVLSNGPLVYVDDDEDDQFLFRQAVHDLGFSNQIHAFPSGMEALLYLETTTEKPLLILSDISMPIMGGLELQQAIDASAHLRKKAVPFLFFTTAAGPAIVNQAYEGNLQGFHTKAPVYADLKEQIRLMVTYWQACLHPNSF